MSGSQDIKEILTPKFDESARTKLGKPYHPSIVFSPCSCIEIQCSRRGCENYCILILRDFGNIIQIDPPSYLRIGLVLVIAERELIAGLMHVSFVQKR